MEHGIYGKMVKMEHGKNGAWLKWNNGTQYLISNGQWNETETRDQNGCHMVKQAAKMVVGREFFFTWTPPRSMYFFSSHIFF